MLRSEWGYLMLWHLLFLLRKKLASYPDDHNIFWSNDGPNYDLNLICFFPFGSLLCCKTGLGFGVLIRLGEGYRIFFPEGIDYYKGWGDMEISPYFHQYIIHVSIFELQGSMLALPVHSGLAVDNPSAWGLFHYHFYYHLLSHLPWG